MPSCLSMPSSTLGRKDPFSVTFKRNSGYERVAVSKCKPLLTFRCNRFKISPGEEALKKAFDKEESLVGAYQQFSSYPSAFVVAADIELSVSLLIFLPWPRQLHTDQDIDDRIHADTVENSSQETPPSLRAPCLPRRHRLTYLSDTAPLLSRDRITRPSPSREPRWSLPRRGAGEHYLCIFPCNCSIL